MPRRPITSPWTAELDNQLKLLSAQGATAIRASAALSKPLSSVRIRARKLGFRYPGCQKFEPRLGNSPRLTRRRPAA